MGDLQAASDRGNRTMSGNRWSLGPTAAGNCAAQGELRNVGCAGGGGGGRGGEGRGGGFLLFMIHQMPVGENRRAFRAQELGIRFIRFRVKGCGRLRECSAPQAWRSQMSFMASLWSAKPTSQASSSCGSKGFGAVSFPKAWWEHKRARENNVIHMRAFMQLQE